MPKDWKGNEVHIKIRKASSKSVIMRTIYDHNVLLDTDTLLDLFHQFPPCEGYFYSVHPLYDTHKDWT